MTEPQVTWLVVFARVVATTRVAATQHSWIHAVLIFAGVDRTGGAGCLPEQIAKQKI